MMGYSENRKGCAVDVFIPSMERATRTRTKRMPAAVSDTCILKFGLISITIRNTLTYRFEVTNAR